jgi:hypothetical protein
MAQNKYVAGRGFNQGPGNYYDWSQNTDNSVQGNTFLFLGSSGPAPAVGRGGGGRHRDEEDDTRQTGQYGFKRFWRGRSELSGISRDQDWRNMKRPAINEGYGPLAKLPGMKGTDTRAAPGRIANDARTVRNAGSAVMRRITSRGSMQPGGAIPVGPGPQERGPIDPTLVSSGEGAKPPGTEFDHVAFHTANADYLERGTIQGPSGMSPLGVSAYPQPRRSTGAGPRSWSRASVGGDVSFH